MSFGLASPDFERLANPESHHLFLDHGTCDIANQTCFSYFLLLLLLYTGVHADCNFFVAAPACISAKKSAVKSMAVEACRRGCDGLKGGQMSCKVFF